MRILVLGGAGTTGRRLAALLLAHSSDEVVLAGRDLGKAERAAGELTWIYPGRVSARRADATDPASLAAAFADVDLVAVAASVLAWYEQVLEAALAAGADCFDLLLSSPAKHAALARLRPRIERDGRCVITDGGVHPGLSAAMIRALAPACGRLQGVDVAALLRVDWNSYSFATSTIEEFVQELLGYRPEALRADVWTRLSWRVATRSFDFGAPFGSQMCSAMALEEIRLLRQDLPELHDAAFWVSGFNPVVDWLVMPLGYALGTIHPRLLGRGYARLLTAALRAFGRPPYGTVWQIEAECVRAAQPPRAGLRLLHPDGYYLTAASAAACLLQYLDGSLRDPGVHLQALTVDPARFLRDLLAMGVACQSYGVDMHAVLGLTSLNRVTACAKR